MRIERTKYKKINTQQPIWFEGMPNTFRYLIFSTMICLTLSACDKNTELMQSAMSGDAQQVKALLDSGVNVNERNNYGWTALHHAARKGEVATLKLLTLEVILWLSLVKLIMIKARI